MPPVHKGEEQTDLNRFHLDVIQFVNEKAVVGQVLLDHFLFGVVRHRGKELSNKVRKKNVAARMPAVRYRSDKSPPCAQIN